MEYLTWMFTDYTPVNKEADMADQSTEMELRVAKAIWDNSPAGIGEWPEDADLYIPVARAAIRAMREPTTEMTVAGTEQWLCESAMEDRSETNWQAMIDAASPATKELRP